MWQAVACMLLCALLFEHAHETLLQVAYVADLQDMCALRPHCVLRSFPTSLLRAAMVVGGSLALHL